MATKTFGDQGQYTYNLDSAGNPTGNPITTATAPTNVTPTTPTASTLTPEQVKQGYSTIPGEFDPLTGQKKTTVYTPEDQKLIDMGITPDELKKLNSPNGLDPASFQGLIGKVEEKLKTNNDLVTQRGYLIKHLFDAPLTADELKALPPEIQSIVKTGDKDTIQLQLRLLNDQISGRANTLTQGIKYLSDGYQTAVDQTEKQKQDAIDNVLKFSQQYGSKASTVLKSLYGAQYLDKLKGMGIDIEAMSNVHTLAEIKKASSGKGGSGGSSLLSKTQVQTGAVNANLSIDAFKKLPSTVQSYFYRNPKTSDGTSLSDWMSEMSSAIKDGSNTRDEVVGIIDDSDFPDEVKNYLKSNLGTSPVAVAKPPTQGFFSKAWSGLKSLIGVDQLKPGN